MLGWDVGAWWIGFPLFAAVQTVVSIPLMFFPRWLVEPRWLLYRKYRELRKDQLRKEQERKERIRRKRKKKEAKRRKRERRDGASSGSASRRTSTNQTDDISNNQEGRENETTENETEAVCEGDSTSEHSNADEERTAEEVEEKKQNSGNEQEKPKSLQFNNNLTHATAASNQTYDVTQVQDGADDVTNQPDAGSKQSENDAKKEANKNDEAKKKLRLGNRLKGVDINENKIPVHVMYIPGIFMKISSQISLEI